LIKNLILILLSLIIILSTYFFVYKKEQEQHLIVSEKLLDVEKIKSIKIASSYSEVQLELKDSTWWVLEPLNYLADGELVEKSLMSMSGLESLESFPLKEDRFGFNKPQAFIEFQYFDEQRLRFSVGSVQAPGQNLYVLNLDTKLVYVFHNIWGQFFYYPEKEFYQKNLPIVGNQVKKIQFLEKGHLIWAIQSLNKKEVQLNLKSKNFVINKSELIWFFNRIREFKLNQLSLNKKFEIKDLLTQMIVETEKGNIIFYFDEKSHKIMIPSLNAFALYDSYSLTSLSDELKKVAKFDKE
jgi:hypothetical protein